MNDIERIITRIITGILMRLKGSMEGEPSKVVPINGKEYKIALTNDADFVLYRVQTKPKGTIPLILAYNGVENISEAIDVISRRIEIDR